MFKYRLHGWRKASLLGLSVIVLALGLFLGMSNLANAENASPSQLPARTGKKGIQAGDLRSGGKDEVWRVNKMVESGAAWVRLDLQSTPEGFDATYRPIIQKLKGQGITVIGLLSYDIWPGVDRARRNDNTAEYDHGNGNNPYVNAFAQKSGQIAAALGNLVDYWEVWNEPDDYLANGNCKSDGGGQQSNLCPSVFAQLMDQTSRAIKSQDSNAVVISGGVKEIDTPYLKQTYAAAISPTLNLGWGTSIPFNGLGIHVYATRASAIGRYITKMVPNNYPSGMGIYITEIGWYTAPSPGLGLVEPVTEQVQAALAGGIYTSLNSRVKTAIWFTLQDQSSVGYFGLFRSDQTPKPAWCSFRGRPLGECTSATRATGMAFPHVNRIRLDNLPLFFDASLDRTRQETSAAVAQPVVNSPTLAEPPEPVWSELVSFLIDLLPTYDYNDSQIDGISTYCYRARIHFLGIPLDTSNEVCLPPAQALYPYGIESVSTIPLTPSYQNLAALFDGSTDYWAIIDYVAAEPVSVILQFGESTTLSGFSIGVGGDPNVPDAYSLTAEAADTLEELNAGSGATYQSIVQDVPTPALENVTVSFPHNFTARFFKFTAVRNEYSRHVHISELTPLLAATTPSGAIVGTVFANSADPTNGLANAYIQICVVGGACHVTTTDNNGHYGVLGLKDGSYLIMAFPPEGSTLLKEQIGPLMIVNGATLADQGLVLSGPVPPPAGTTITSRGTTSDGIPVVYWAEPLTLSTTGCANGSAEYTLTQDDMVKRSGSLLEETAGAYTTEIEPLQPIHGTASILITLTCPDDTTEERHFDLYIDPSGIVRTWEGAPVAGATVTLYHADTLTGTFEVVPDGSALMSPMNRRNPDSTDANGHFGWDVLAGYYKVRAEKLGCTSIDDPDQSYTESAVQIIPPAVTDLDLQLDCPDSVPPTITMTTSPLPNASGWNNQDVTLTLTASDEAEGSGVQDITYSASGAQAIEPTTVPGNTASFLISTEGSTTVTYGATDNAGNSSAPQTLTAQLDKTAPTISIGSPLPQDYTHSTSLNLTWTVSDLLSGAGESAGQLDGNVVTNGQALDLLSLNLGAHTLTVSASDVAGNAAQQSVTFTVTASMDSLSALVQQACTSGAITRREACVALKTTVHVAQDLIQHGKYALARQVLRAFNVELLAIFKGHWMDQATYERLKAEALFVINTLPQ